MEAMVVFWLLGFLLALVWLFLPLAIVGTKSILREQLAELKGIHKAISAMERLP